MTSRAPKSVVATRNEAVAVRGSNTPPAERALDRRQAGAEVVDQASGTLGRHEPGGRAHEQLVLQGRAQPRERMAHRRSQPLRSFRRPGSVSSTRL